MVETVAFEFMLGRLAGKLGEALGRLLNLPRDGRAWFMHHSEVDVRHAEEGLDNLVRYAAEYGIPADDALALAELTLRENVFIRGYFGTERAEAEA